MLAGNTILIAVRVPLFMAQQIDAKVEARRKLQHVGKGKAARGNYCRSAVIIDALRLGLMRLDRPGNEA